jgi:CheY-like chemotaxis protein
VEAVRKLRGKGYSKLVVGVTGNILDEDVANFVSAGADMVLGKPVKINMLKMLLNHVHENGPLSVPDMTLFEEDGALAWKKKKG